jgi:hypothetical protein
MWQIVTAGGLEVEVAFLAPVATVSMADATPPTRHHVAQAARTAIAAHLGLAGAESPPAPAAGP